MQINRGLVFWGVALITAGVVALAIVSDVIDGDQALQLWQYWPVALIAIGLAIIAARTPFALIATLVAAVVVGGLAGTLVSGWPQAFSVGCGGEADGELNADGSFGDRADVELDFNCGDLAVGMGDGSDWAVDARYAGDSRPEVTSGDGSLRVNAEDGGLPFSEGRQEWSVTLPTESELALSIEANASSSTLDLAGGSFIELNLDTNAGSVELDLSGATADGLDIEMNAGSMALTADDETAFIGSVEMNAGSMELCIPDGVSFAITLQESNITFSHNLDESGLSRSGDTWRGGSGTEAITLNVQGNAASFTLNPDGGCS
ncbi:MAG TPA: DUF5668 domain-containing protein [Candidatus Limnocylindria bacterium]